MTILQYYVLKELRTPVILSILFFTGVLLLGKLFDMAELLLLARVGWDITVELLGIVALSLIVLTVPMAVLLGTLSGVGRMTSENEILAMRVGGVALWRVFWPYFLITGLLSFALMWANWSHIPSLIQRLAERQTELQFRILTNLEPGRNYNNLSPRASELAIYFNSRGAAQPGDSDYVLRMNQVALRVVGETEGLTGARVAGATPTVDETDTTIPGPRETVFYASSGVIVGDLETRAVTITLFDGTIIPINRLVLDRATEEPIKRESRYREAVLRFETMTQSVSPRGDRRSIERMDPRTLRVDQLRELIAQEPQGAIRDLTSRKRIAPAWATYLNARNEYYQRITIPFSLLAFSLIAVPLAVELRPKARTMSFLLSLVVILVYYGLVTLANAVGMTNSPWTFPLFVLPNVLVGGLGIILFWRT